MRRRLACHHLYDSRSAWNESGDRLLRARSARARSVTMIVGGLLLSGDSSVVCRSLVALLIAPLLLLMFGIWRFRADRARVHGICRCDPASTTIGLIAGVLLYDRLFAARTLRRWRTRWRSSRPSALYCSAAFDGGALQRVLKKPLSFIEENRHERQQCCRPSDGHCQPCSGDHNDGKMDEREDVNATFLVSAASTIAAHMGFTFGTDPDLSCRFSLQSSLEASPPSVPRCFHEELCLIVWLIHEKRNKTCAV